MKVLIVDDEQDIVQMVKINLEMDGLQVCTAKNGKEGIEKAKAVHPDLVLMDWMMPEMNGINAVRAMKRDPSLKNIPIFMMTARSQMADIDHAFGAGADNYISKPFDPVTLSSTIEGKLLRVRRTEHEN